MASDANFIILKTIEDVKALRDSREDAVEHFHGSYKMAEAFWNGLIDWDGNELEY